MFEFEAFVEGRQPKHADRQYVTLIDFPVPVLLDTGIYVKRVRMVIDVTGYGLSPDASDEDFDGWLLDDEERLEAFRLAAFNAGIPVRTDPAVIQEARDFLAGFGRTIK